MYLLYLGLSAGGGILEGAGADGADLRTEHGNGYDGHDLAAGSGLNKLDIGSLGVIDELGRVAGAAGLEAGRKARGKVAPVGRAADKDSGGIIFAAENGEEVSVGFGIVSGVAGAGDVDDAVYTRSP